MRQRNILACKLCLLLSTLTGLFTASAVQAQQPAQRVISLAPHITEMLYSAGAGNKIVGVVNYSDYPADALKKPIVGSYNAINIEKIIELQPDLVLSWRSGNRLQDNQRLQQLQQQLGFRLIESEVDTLEDIPALIEQFGELIGTQQTAQTVTQQLRQQLQTIKQEYTSKKTVSVFYQIWNKPLITPGNNQFISQGIALCGGENIFNDIGTLTGQVAIETVLLRNPQVLLMGGRKEMQQEWVKTWQAFPQIQAVKNEHVFLLNNNLYQRPTARFINALPALCNKIDRAR